MSVKATPISKGLVCGQVSVLTECRTRFALVLVALLILFAIPPSPMSVFAASSASIELQGIRWNKFPLKVFVDMNQWSKPLYAFAVREAIDIWMRSFWTYGSSFNDTTLRIIGYTFYVSNINATSSYDIFITFTQHEVSSNVVGLTTYKWNPITHDAIPPLTINITTYSGTASQLFVRNIAMHEFGHALGLGHTLSWNTMNGPELMYFSTPIERKLYPSTLDLYALAALYSGSFSRSVQLPSSIPYEMVEPTEDSLLDTRQSPVQPDLDIIDRLLLEGLSAVIQSIRESDGIDVAMLAAFLVAVILVSALGKEHNDPNGFQDQLRRS